MTDGLLAMDRVRPGFRRCEPELLLARAWVACAHGERSRGQATAMRAADRAAAMGQRAVALAVAYDALRIGAHGAAALVTATGTGVDGAFAPLAVRHAAALRGRDGAALGEVSVALERLGFDLHAADATAAAAAAHHAAGHRSSELAAAARAEELRSRCDGAWTPALADSRTPLPLTHRERDIAMLAAAGLSNREIAARLFIGVRTVEGHLNRAFPKLGITKRSELTEVLGNHAPAAVQEAAWPR
jgi:DNA-binding CsgD family transcriptional regulator